MTSSDAAGSAAEISNPALERLGWLVGRWSIIGKHPQVPDTTFHGRIVFERHLGGAFLLMRSEMAEPEVPAGLAFIGSDHGEETYHMIYFDQRGISRHMHVVAGDGFIQWRREIPAFRQIWTITRLANDRLEGVGRMSRNGEDWEDDLSLSYKREAKS